MTTRSEFAAFVEATLEELLRFTEAYTGAALSRKMKFRWLGDDAPIEHGIVEAIVNKVYLDLEHIYPCVDIGVGDLSDDGYPIIVANISGYSPTSFQENWTGRDGPFVFIIGNPFLEKLAGKKIPSNRVFGFITPDMKRLRS